MRRTDLLEETRKMRFEELYSGWNDIRKEKGTHKTFARLNSHHSARPAYFLRRSH
jgi:hypothetical protein